MKLGYIPSFCTACYRSGRTGEKFMDLAKPGEIHTFCQPNALLTLKEYLEDYAKDGEIIIGKKLIAKQLNRILNSKMKSMTQKKLREINSGKRDLYF
jgi:2-iminoacetate synthase